MILINSVILGWQLLYDEVLWPAEARRIFTNMPIIESLTRLPEPGTDTEEEFTLATLFPNGSTRTDPAANTC